MVDGLAETPGYAAVQSIMSLPGYLPASRCLGQSPQLNPERYLCCRIVVEANQRAVAAAMAQIAKACLDHSCDILEHLPHLTIIGACCRSSLALIARPSNIPEVRYVSAMACTKLEGCTTYEERTTQGIIIVCRWEIHLSNSPCVSGNLRQLASPGAAASVRAITWGIYRPRCGVCLCISPLLQYY